ncbi:hypothetical protein CBR_g4302 [Chara braunii]|uniref:Uncharacterized protein n=1 Tax=Chara braunii TaxID=69332 RepID=A0A388JRB2_CHABU|nr:hypothetical protein CBR_g4302 [Chara braunii]|eukprot:GBG60346.1 hypothetical protein CBR_g4302 [Chara braunii]
MMEEYKQRAATATTARKKRDEEVKEQRRLAEQQRQEDADAARKAADEHRRQCQDRLFEREGDLEVIAGEWAEAADEEDAPAAVRDLSLDPRVVRSLDEFADIFKSPTGMVPNRPISHETMLEASVVSLKGCIYRMSEEELAVLHTQLDDLDTSQDRYKSKFKTSYGVGTDLGKMATKDETRNRRSEGGPDIRGSARGYTDFGEEYERRADIPYNLNPENFTDEFSPAQGEEDEDEDEKVQEVIEVSSGDETDKISRPGEEGRPSTSRLQEGSFRWEDEFRPTHSHWFEQWVSVIKHDCIIKARELMEAGVAATPLDFYNEKELQEIAKRNGKS